MAVLDQLQKYLAAIASGSGSGRTGVPKIRTDSALFILLEKLVQRFNGAPFAPAFLTFGNDQLPNTGGIFFLRRGNSTAAAQNLVDAGASVLFTGNGSVASWGVRNEVASGAHFAIDYNLIHTPFATGIPVVVDVITLFSDDPNPIVHLAAGFAYTVKDLLHVTAAAPAFVLGQSPTPAVTVTTTFGPSALP